MAHEEGEDEDIFEKKSENLAQIFYAPLPIIPQDIQENPIKPKPDPYAPLPLFETNSRPVTRQLYAELPCNRQDKLDNTKKYDSISCSTESVTITCLKTNETYNAFQNAEYISIGALKLQKIDHTLLENRVELGSGNFGKVYKAEWQETFVAVKELKLDSALQTKEFEREVEQLAQLNHPRVVCFYGVSLAQLTHIVMEYCPFGTLRTLLDTKKDLTWSEKTNFARDIALGLSYLHNNKILHIDLAADNVLLDGQKRAKLADFGLAVKEIQGKLDLLGHSKQMRWAWNSPEVLLYGSECFSTHSDIYCFGVVLWEISTGLEPLATVTVIEQGIQEVCSENREKLDPLRQDTPPSFAHVMRACWVRNPKDRLSAETAFHQLGNSEFIHTPSVIPPNKQIRTFLEISQVLKQCNLQTSKQWQNRFEIDLPFIPPFVCEDNNLPAVVSTDIVDNFLSSNKKVMLLLGSSGTGKSSFLAQTTQQQWTKFQTSSWMVLLLSLPTILHPEQNLIETILVQQGLTTEEVAYLKQQQTQLLLMLDGYDEINSTENIFVTNCMWEWNVKVVISCRPERINGAFGISKNTFFPCIKHNQQPNGQYFQQWIIQSFQENQIKEYLQQFYALKQGVDYSNITSDMIQSGFEQLQNFKQVIQNPFLLFLVVTVLPNLEIQSYIILGNNNKKRITQMDIYCAFMQQWFQQQQQKLIDQNVQSKQTTLATKMMIFAENLALTMFEQNVQIVHYIPQNTFYGQTEQQIQQTQLWGKYFDNRCHPQVPHLRSGCMLHSPGPHQWQFLHKSLWEYLIAQSILNQLHTLSVATSDSSLILNASLLNLELKIVEFLAEQVCNSERLKQVLFEIVFWTRKDKNCSIAAANAITILNFAKVSFSGMDLSAISIPYAILTGAVMHCTNFNNSDLRFVNFSSAFLDDATFCSSLMNDVQFGQLPLLVHDSCMHSICFLLDSKSLVTSVYTTIYLWDIIQSTVINTFTGHKKAVTTLSVSPDGEFLASGSSDKSVRLWHIKSGQRVKKLQGHTDEVNSVSFSSDGKLVASGSRDKSIMLWNIKSGQCVHNLQGHTEPVTTVCFSGDGKLLASGSYDYGVCLWDIESGQCVHKLKGHSALVTSVCFSGDGKFLASAGWDQSVLLWDIERGEYIHKLQGHTKYITSLCFSGDGKVLASGSYDNSVRLWDVENGLCVQNLQGHTASIQGVSFSKDGKYLASGSSDCSVRLWNLEGGQYVQNLQGHTKNVICVGFSADDKLVSSGSEDCSVMLWEIESGQCVQNLQGHTNAVASVCFNGDGNLIASGSYDKSVWLWDLETGKCIRKLQQHSKAVNGVCFIADGTLLASGSYDKSVGFCDIDSGECILKLQQQTKAVNCVSFSANGALFAFGGRDRSIQMSDIGSMQRLGKNPHLVNFGGDSNFIVSETLVDVVWVWDIGSGECVHKLQGHTRNVNAVCFSSDGKLLASGSGDNNVWLWDIESEQCVQKLKGHSNWVTSVCFSGDGKLLASGSYDKSVRVWDIESGQCVHNLQGHTDYVNCVSFSKNGKFVASGSRDHSVMLWGREGGQKFTKDTTKQDLHSFILLAIFSQTRTLSINKVNISGAVGLSAANNRLIGQGNYIDTSKDYMSNYFPI